MQNSEIARNFFNEWHKGQSKFELFTSGSTGVPKVIKLTKKGMQWSAMHTAHVINPQPDDTILCCLPCTKIGGLMMLVRSIEWQIPVEIIEPIANPFLAERKSTIVSLTPFQLFHILNLPESIKHLKKNRVVIIGGGELSETIEWMIKKNDFESTLFYHSYGMTETYSHIALRAINGENATSYFIPFEDVKITTDENKCALIKLPFDDNLLKTSDIIQLNADYTFELTGRIDFMINTGGVKIQPEIVEKAITKKLHPKNTFIISSEKDPVLGNRLILIAEKDFEYGLEDLRFLKEINSYAVPKTIKIIAGFRRNDVGKIKRI